MCNNIRSRRGLRAFNAARRRRLTPNTLAEETAIVFLGHPRVGTSLDTVGTHGEASDNLSRRLQQLTAVAPWTPPACAAAAVARPSRMLDVLLLLLVHRSPGPIKLRRYGHAYPTPTRQQSQLPRTPAQPRQPTLPMACRGIQSRGNPNKKVFFVARDVVALQILRCCLQPITL